jgi:hypothetical protein
MAQPQYAQPQYAQPQQADPFVMPTPIAESEIPPTSGQLPPHYEAMDTPAGHPQSGDPMNAQPPGPAPMHMGIPANQTAYPRMMPQGLVPTGGIRYESHRQQPIPVRL